MLIASKSSATRRDASAPGATRTADSAEQNTKLVELYRAITVGASAFLNAEYKLCALFVAVVYLVAKGLNKARIPPSPRGAGKKGF